MKIYQFENLPKVPKMKYFYLIYCRKSTESEDRQVASIESQYDVLCELAKQKGLEILQYFSESKSAKKPGRSEFNKMIELVNSRDDIKGIVCWKLNRLSRNPQDSGVLRQMLSDKTLTEIVTYSKTYVEADSDFLMAIEDAQSQRFIRDLKEDTARGINSKLDKGHAPILAPVGYKNNKEMNQGEKTISPHPIYFDLMREIFNLALTGNYSLQALVDEAKKMGIYNNLGRQISKSQMAKVVHNVFYTGRFVYGKILHQGAHTPMLTDEEFDALQDITSRTSRPRKAKHEHPLSNFIKCHYCGYHIIFEHKEKKSGWKGIYAKCANRYNNKLKVKCPQKYLRADLLDTQVKDFLSSITLKPSFVEWATKCVRESETQDKAFRNAKYEALRKKNIDLETRLDNLTEKWLAPENSDKTLLSNEEFRTLKQKYMIEKQKTLTQQKTLNTNVNSWLDFIYDSFNFALNAKKLWDTGHIESQKLILSVIGANIVLQGDKLNIIPDAHFEKIQKLSSHQDIEANSRTERFARALLGG